jgi:hypothetical protein
MKDIRLGDEDDIGPTGAVVRHSVVVVVAT